MTPAESELREIFSQFRQQPESAERLIKRLLDIRERYLYWRSNPELSPKKKEEHLARIEQHLSSARALYGELFPHLKALQVEVPLTAIRNKKAAFSTYRYPGKDRHLLDKHDPWEYQICIFSDLLTTARMGLASGKFALDHKRNQYWNVQISALISAGDECWKCGMKISYSANSQFYKIAQWVLGLADPKTQIQRAKPFIGSDGY